MAVALLAARISAAPSYVGSQACLACHKEIGEYYQKMPMAKTSGRISHFPPAGAFTQKAAGERFVIEGSQVRQSRATHTLSYFIGSGAAGRSFLFSHDGFLFLAPVTFYTEAQRWDMSPGYQHARENLWNRPIEPNCLFCHSTRPQPIYGTQNRYAEPPFLEEGIGCERCHGPGSEHVARTGPIVNPAKLAPAQRDSICAQCHLTGKARIDRPAMQLAMFRPGAKLSDYVSVFIASDAAEARLRVTSHMEKLSYSACRQKSGEALWCGSCHSQHRSVDFRSKCLHCHESKLTREHAGREHCASCHMPRTQAADSNHGVFTDHSIPRQSRPPAARKSKGVLIPFPGFASDDRTLGLAYAEAALESNDPSHRREALRLLRQALPANTNDWNLLTRLAFLESPERALPLYQRSLAIRPQQPVALINAGAIHAQSGNLNQAIDYFRKALAMNPGLTEASRNLATALRATGRADEARQVIRQALMFAPEVDR